MQPVEAQKGVSSKSQLFNSLKDYLNIKNRLQPIIGLGSITECVKAGTHNRELLYLCEVCVCRLSKADMRNHILGSLHRYNYIKAWHPHLVSEWKRSDLSNLARPLMDMAKILEGQEGPGDVQRVEVEDALYQKMATLSENDAVSLITMLRNGHSEPKSHSETTSVQLQHYPMQPQRIVLLAQNQQSKNMLKASSETKQTGSFIKPEGWDKNTSSDPSMQPENSFLDGYTGTKPLIGLFRLVECRGEDGQTYCFLCHCCRIRSSKEDLISHLTGSSHLMNHLMETHPEQVEIIMADINDNNWHLLSLAEKVEEEEGRGVPKVVNVPESLCSLLTVKSYHWCIKMLRNEGAHTNIQKLSPAKGPCVGEISPQGTPEKCAVMQSQWASKMTAQRKKRKASNTVFKVSLPLTEGSVLLKRTSFSTDSLPASDADHIPLPGSQSEDCEWDYDTGSFAMNRAEHASQVHQYQHYFTDNKHFKQSEDTTATKYKRFYYDDDYNSSPERSRERFYNEWKNECPQTQNQWLSPAVSYNQNWSSLNCSYRLGAGCTEQWYNSTSEAQVGTTRENKWNKHCSGESQYYYQQQPQSQYTAQDHRSLQTCNVEKRGPYNEFAAHSDVAEIQMQPHIGSHYAHGGSFAPEPRGNFDFEQRQMQTYTRFPFGCGQTVPQSHMTQLGAHQTIPVGQWMMSNPSYNIKPMRTPHQFPYPVSHEGGDWAYLQVKWLQHRQALCYGARSDGVSDSMISGSSH